MCAHIRILHLSKNNAYCKDCKQKIVLPERWTEKYKPTVNVDEYLKK